jgi:N-methylhydantoinase A
LNPKESNKAIKSNIGAALGLGLNESAYGISQMVDESMANAARVHAVEHGKEISDRTMIAFGGNGALHATRIAEKIGVSRIVIPKDPGVGSAVGFLSAPISYEIIRSLYMRGEQFDLDAVKNLFKEMGLEARAVVQAGNTDAELKEKRMAFMRYEGQGHEIEIELPSGPLRSGLMSALRQRFDQNYKEQFGRIVPNVDVEILNWAFIAATPGRKTKSVAKPKSKKQPKPVGSRKIYWGQSRKKLEVPHFQRERLRSGDYLHGPAVITEAQTTTLVSPGFQANIDKVGNIILSSMKKSSRKV